MMRHMPGRVLTKHPGLSTLNISEKKLTKPLWQLKVLCTTPMPSHKGEISQKTSKLLLALLLSLLCWNSTVLYARSNNSYKERICNSLVKVIGIENVQCLSLTELPYRHRGQQTHKNYALNVSGKKYFIKTKRLSTPVEGTEDGLSTAMCKSYIQISMGEQLNIFKQLLNESIEIVYPLNDEPLVDQVDGAGTFETFIFPFIEGDTLAKLASDFFSARGGAFEQQIVKEAYTLFGKAVAITTGQQPATELLTSYYLPDRHSKNILYNQQLKRLYYIDTIDAYYPADAPLNSEEQLENLWLLHKSKLSEEFRDRA
ncbi:MAG: hypothetical protein ACR2PT_01300, partial [Endozoicomonas sp.]